MPKVSQAHLDARRRQIIDASSACFYRKGFHLSTMQDICKEAQLSPGAIYRYFASKDDIIKAIAEENRNSNIQMIERMRQEVGDYRIFLDQLVETFFRMIDEFDQHPTKLNIEIWAETFRNERVRAMQSETFKAYEQVLGGFLRDGQKVGYFQPDIDPDSFGRILVSFFDGLLVQKGVDPTVDVWAYVATMKWITRSIYCEPEHAKAQ